jgi:CheY-like chemotaxis protein
MHAASLLRSLGYAVTIARDGLEALAFLESCIKLDLLFTDVIMPGGINGPELARRAQALRPGLPVLYTSGYTENAIVHHGKVDRGINLLHKPYDRHTLARKIRSTLEQRNDAGR